MLGNADLVRTLLKRPSVDPSIADNDGVTPLHVAAQSSPELVELILTSRESECRELAMLADLQGKRPLDYAVACKNDMELVIAPLRQLTEVAPIDVVSSQPIDYSHTVLLVGEDIPMYQRDEFDAVATRDGVTITHVGDGTVKLSLADLDGIPAKQGGCAIIMCHGMWDEVTMVHKIYPGTEFSLPTEDFVRLLYNKGIRKMTFFACEIGKGAEDIVVRMNQSTVWPKPLDPQLEITFVGGKHSSFAKSGLDDMRNCLGDIGSLHNKRSGGLMSKLSAASTVTITPGETGGLAVMERTSSLALDKRGELSDEEYSLVVEKLLLKYLETDQISKLEDLVALEKVGVNFTGPGDSTPLHMAVREGKLEFVKMLVGKEGVKLNEPGPGEHTPLEVAAFNGRGDIVAVLLKQPGIDVNLPNSNDSTPLHVAVENGRTAVVEELLKIEGVQVNSIDSNGKTPLQLAFDRGDVAMVEMLLKRADIDVGRMSASGRNLLDDAVTFDNIEMVKVLVARQGFEVNQTGRDGWTMLGHAVITKNMTLVGVLLGADGIDIHQEEESGKSPLYIAAESGNYKMAELLVERGARDQCPAGHASVIAFDKGHDKLGSMLMEH